MILERAAAYLLAFACLLQALHPSRIVNAQKWRRIDIQIGQFRLQTINCTDALSFKGLAGDREEGICSSERPVLLLHGRLNNLKRLSICIGNSVCITEWLTKSHKARLVSEDQ